MKRLLKKVRWSAIIWVAAVLFLMIEMQPKSKLDSTEAIENVPLQDSIQKRFVVMDTLLLNLEQCIADSI